jgi:hypothetical protein
MKNTTSAAVYSKSNNLFFIHILLSGPTVPLYIQTDVVTEQLHASSRHHQVVFHRARINFFHFAVDALGAAVLADQSHHHALVRRQAPRIGLGSFFV